MKLKLIAVAVSSAFSFSSLLQRAGLALGAIATELSKEEHGKLPKDVQSLYVEKDGKFKLDVEMEDTAGLKSALEKERKAAREAERVRKELEKKFEGLDADEVRKMMEKIGGDEEAQLIKSGKLDEVVARRMEKANQAHKKALEDLAKARDAEKARADKFSQRVLDNHVRAAATKAGLHPNAVDDALFRARTLFALNEDGDAVQLNNGEVVMGKDGKTPFSPGEWLEGMREQAPHWFPAGNSGGNAGANKGAGGGGRTIKRADFDKLSPIEKQSTAKEANEGKVKIVD